MKKILFLLLLFSGMAKAQIVNIPDPAFKAYLLSADFSNNIAVNSSLISAKIDINNDGEIQVSEASDIVRLWINGPQIINVQGLEAFTNLEEMTIYDTGIASFGLAMPNLPKFQIKSNALLTTVNVSGMTGLTQLDCNLNASLTALNVSGCNGIVSLAANNNLLSGLDVSGLSNLVNFSCYYNQLTSLNLSGCSSLHGLSANNNLLTAVDVSGLTNLAAMDLSNNPALTNVNAAGCSALDSSFLNLTNDFNLITLNLSNCSHLTTFALVGTSLNYLDVSGCSSLNDLQVQNNNLQTLLLDGCSALVTLVCTSNHIASLDLTDAVALQYLFANDNDLFEVDFHQDANLSQCTVYDNELTHLDFSGMTNLVVCQFDNNPLLTLDISGCSSMQTLSIPAGITGISSINAQGCTALTQLSVQSPLIQSVNVQGCTGLNILAIGGTSANPAPISTLDLTGVQGLTYLNLSNVNISSVDLTANPALGFVNISVTPLTQIDLSGQSQITNLNLSETSIQNLDISEQANISIVNVYGCTQLETIWAKNGANEFFNFEPNNETLHFICQDEAYVTDLQSQLAAYGLTAVCNSYCSMTPGGDFNTISGIVRFDSGNDGCDETDVVQPNMKINITDGTEQGATFTDTAGLYQFFTGAGNFDIGLGIENPSIFNISTSAPTIAFADNNNNTGTFNFCISPNGNQNDAEIVIAPITPARPGFTALYQVVIKNKGNQTLNGSFNFTYDDTLMDFVVATTAVTSQSAGMLNWTYSNLLPFENRSVYVLLNVNSPTQVPPVNQDDILPFTATINPIVNDINAADNQFMYNQSVVNSFDPNDITCMEGENLSPQDIGKYLHYVINFENTGTYAAEQVVVKVVIDDTKYDINSIQLLNTSHPVRPVIKGNTAEFFFEGIDLAAAAGDPPVGGHGNILFKIRTQPTLVNGDDVITKADIFFDYNFPIETNDARTVFATLSSGNPLKDDSIVLYPNPSKNFVTIQCDNSITSVSLYDIQGRILEILKQNDDSATIDISARASGIYFVKTTTDKGVKVIKMVKE
ncbi:DUF7619 domain-containing protein [Flavobacterium pallidum]|nr:T9SS type A sorting domain-containing protein [Flavobacterium pallidum]